MTIWIILWLRVLPNMYHLYIFFHLYWLVLGTSTKILFSRFMAIETQFHRLLSQAAVTLYVTPSFFHYPKWSYDKHKRDLKTNYFCSLHFMFGMILNKIGYLKKTKQKTNKSPSFRAEIYQKREREKEEAWINNEKWTMLCNMDEKKTKHEYC